MKKILISVILGIIITFVITSYSSTVQSDIAGNLLRLHVIANSDSSSDQELKLKVRDRLLAESSDLFSDTESIDESKQIVENNIEFLESAARDEITSRGFDYDVRIKTEKCFFPVKSYGSLTLPSGEYEAVKVEIGKAEGKNWWCVMFPPLCFVNGTVNSEKSLAKLKDSLSEEEYDIVTSGEVDFRFKIVDVVQSSYQTIKTALNK